ncbi:hypothetical protein [Fimbriiglobus ruber]|uniref:Uncharacterized protein n=1 Tax=Fimbriiglobus ruber TaxID=1908690 RepID=A0A225DH40_9BACT|nr:hypothetical protein [Fimbriiglobus ruber]OWK40303.1 hypothetical protein FRUB_05222 [Fimbriiglobus ruber]
MGRMFAVMVVAFVVSVGSASAQGMSFKPIDTTKLVVQPADATTNILSGTSKVVSRSVAGVVDSNKFVRAINTLFGKKATPTTLPTQSGLSAIPAAGSYPSTTYRNSFTPAMPSSHIFGQSAGR